MATETTTPAPSYAGSEPYVFVSYAHSDSDLVYPEIARLQHGGTNVWYDEGIGVGLSWRDEVALAISESELFIIFMSANAANSAVCREELFLALSRERKVVVIYLEECQLTPGMELGLADKQAIMRFQLSEDEYSSRLDRTLSAYEIQEPEAPQRDVIHNAVGGIAIMPLSIIGSNEESEHLADGIAEELLNGLASIDGLRVVSGFMFRSQALDVRNVGLRFKVETILGGSIQQAGQRIRINMRLTSTAGSETLWVERYDFNLTDIFDVQDQVAAGVLEALRLREAKDRTVLEYGTSNVEAYEAFLRGMTAKRRHDREGMEQAVEFFGRATEIDPTFNRAWYMMGFSFWELTFFLGHTPELIGFAEEAFAEARKRGYEPELPWLQIERKLHPDRRPSQSILLEEALNIIDEQDASWQNFELIQVGRCLGAAGHYQAAAEFLSMYLEKVPSNSSEVQEVREEADWLLPILGRFTEAINRLNDLLAKAPEDQSARVQRCMLYSRTGQYEKAAVDLAALSSTRYSAFARCYHAYWRDDLETAELLLQEVLDAENIQLRYKFRACALLGRFDDAVTYMREAAGRGSPMFHIRMLVSNAIPEKQRLALEDFPAYREFLAENDIGADWPDTAQEAVNHRSNLTNIRVVA